ncbi:MAG: hypothetical protein PHX61_07745, partial [Alphaproteobacteria bacterium]|nr:hypothetical protein [Alphaproteobacteria bacterium]
ISEKVFDKWTGDTKYVADAKAASTTLTMPNKAVNLVATYKTVSTNKYILTIKNGTGSGAYAQGTKVTITANAAISEKVFDKWTGDTKYVADAKAASTTLTMPNKAVNLVATYKTVPGKKVTQTLKATVLPNNATVNKGAKEVKLLEATLTNTGTETLAISGLGVLSDFGANYVNNSQLYIDGVNLGKPDKIKVYEVIYKSLELKLASGESATVLLKGDISPNMKRKALSFRLDACPNIFGVKGAESGKKAKVSVDSKAYLYFREQ